ncbi:MAG: nitrate/nitrite transporter [Candidatus Bathyarchaeia archaeon]
MSREERRYRWVILALLFVTFFTLILHWIGFAPLLPAIKNALGISFSEIGFLAATVSFAYMVMGIVGGILYDRFNARWLLRIGFVVAGVAALARGFATDFTSILVVHIVLGAALAQIFIGLPRLTAQWFPAKETGFASGVYFLGWPIGTIFVLSASPIFLQVLGEWTSVFRAYGIWSILLLAIWWTLAREPREAISERTFETSTSRHFLEGVKVAFRNREVWLLASLFFCVLGISTGVITWLPAILENQGLSSVSAGFVAATIPAGFAVGSVLLGTFSDKSRLRKPFMWIPGLFAGPLIFTLILTEGFALILIAFVLGFTSMGIATLLFTVVSELPSIQGYHLGGAVGLMVSFGNSGGFVLPVAMGHLVDTTGSFLSAMILPAILGAAIPVLAFALKETQGSRLQS